MNALTILDVSALVLDIALLYMFGQYDKKYRIVPLLPFILFLSVSVAFLAYRLYIADAHMKTVTLLSLIVSGGLVAGLIPLATMSNMLGIGDILLVLASSLLVPYPPLGVEVRSLPVVTPLSVILAVAIIYYVRRKITVYKSDFPPGYRRVVKVRAGWLKKQEVVKRTLSTSLDTGSSTRRYSSPTTHEKLQNGFCQC